MSPRGEHLNNRSQSFYDQNRQCASTRWFPIRRGDPPQSSWRVARLQSRKLRRAEAIACVRLKRQEANQNLGFASRPFVLCGLPIKKPGAGQLLHERRNGQFSLQVTGHPSYGLPWGQDRLIPIFLATLAIRQQSQTIQFRSAAEMLDSFGMQQGWDTVPKAGGRFPADSLVQRSSSAPICNERGRPLSIGLGSTS